MLRAVTRQVGIFATLSFFLLASLPMAGATSQSASACGWDSQPGWVQRENAKPGDASWDRGIPMQYAGDFAGKELKMRKGGPFRSWLAPSVAANGPEGWFSAPSAMCDQNIGLHISGTGAPVTIRVFRMGFYGGTGARLIS